MREPDWDHVDAEDVLVLQALAAAMEQDDDEIGQATREAWLAVSEEAMALKARRERREDEVLRAAAQARREARERAAREEAARVESERRAARRLAEARERARVEAERRERARREEQARREAIWRRAEERARGGERRRERERPRAAERPRPAPPVRKPITAHPKVVPAAVVDVVHAPDPEPCSPQEPAPLTGTSLARWRVSLGLTQQQAADRLGVRQGTISKAEGRDRRPLGPALQEALSRELGAGRPTR